MADSDVCELTASPSRHSDGHRAPPERALIVVTWLARLGLPSDWKRRPVSWTAPFLLINYLAVTLAVNARAGSALMPGREASERPEQRVTDAQKQAGHTAH